ncbi:MAG: ankyrin repeat domain-containing protein [Nitrospinaceae bacterium]
MMHRYSLFLLPIFIILNLWVLPRAGATPIEDAVLSGNGDLVKLLVENGAEIDSIDSLGFTPLHRAALAGYRDIVEVLLANGAEVDATDIHGYTPLHLAVQGGFVEVASLLIAHGADVNARAADDQGRDITPLYLAIILDNSNLAGLLTSNGAK